LRPKTEGLVLGPARRLAALALCGVGLGFALSRMGFTRFEEVHAMFTFADLRLFLVFAFGVLLTGIGFLPARLRALPKKTFHRGTVPGAILFGLGWAVCGACPGVVLAQLGEGQVHGLVIAAGVAAGVLVHRRVASRMLSQ
jgi:uncharacterized membrane protein YedE/YeeE